MTASRRDEARSGGLVGLVWCALMTFMALVSIAAAALAVKPSDITASGVFLLWGMPDLGGFGAAFTGLATAGRMAIALALGAAGFMTLATAWGDRAFYRAQKSQALTSRRLALTRFILLGVIAGAAWLQLNAATDPHLLIGAAIGLSAVAVAPMLALSLWPRADGQDAATGLVAGLAMAEAVVVFSGGSASIDTLAGAAMTGFASALAAGVGASLRHPAGPVSEGAAFAHGLLHGPVDVLRPDKDA